VYYIGLIILLPWNILITVNGYWDYKFRNVSLDNSNETQTTELQKAWKYSESRLMLSLVNVISRLM
jgi:hypothetical protein